MKNIDKYYHEHSEKFDLDTYMERLIETTQCTPKERKDSFEMWCYIKNVVLRRSMPMDFVSIMGS